MIDFSFEKEGEFSSLMEESGIVSFNDACRFVSTIPYQRISNRADLSLVFHERKGTCSSKHAFLKKIAEEQNVSEVKLVLIFFKMSGKTHEILSSLFELVNIDYIPEAHICLKHGNEYLDFTTRYNWSISEFVMKEQEIGIDDMLRRKDDLHKAFIKEWNSSEYELEEIWKWREKCIELLSKQ